MTERLWFKIGEAAQRLGITPKDLRYWEKVIPELKPRRSKGNLRYYHVDEFPRLERIRQWLSEGLTVRDCRDLLLHGHLVRTLDLGLEEPAPEPPAVKASRKPETTRDLAPILKALRALRAHLRKPLLPGRPEPTLDLPPKAL